MIITGVRVMTGSESESLRHWQARAAAAAAAVIISDARRRASDAQAGRSCGQSRCQLECDTQVLKSESARVTRTTRACSLRYSGRGYLPASADSESEAQWDSSLEVDSET